jgi:hypothetical protein
MGVRRWVWLCLLVLAATSACDEAKPALDRIPIAAAHRSCEEGEACGVVETSCQSRGCECGTAVNEAFLLEYQKRLAECRGSAELASCDFVCETPFAKCFEGACVLTDEPPELFRRGRSVQALCERTRGAYVGCPECPPNERCRSCKPCDCPSTHRWTTNGCRAVVQTEARNIRVDTRPKRLRQTDVLKARVHNESRRPIWLKTVCGTPFYRARKKQDTWEKAYEPSRRDECRSGALKLAPGERRPFVIGSLADFQSSSGEKASPGTYRFELSYTDGTKRFDYFGLVYSAQFDLVAEISSR